MATGTEMIGCECGCDCCQPAPTAPEDERESLLRRKAAIEERLAELEVPPTLRRRRTGPPTP